MLFLIPSNNLHVILVFFFCFVFMQGAKEKTNIFVISDFRIFKKRKRDECKNLLNHEVEEQRYIYIYTIYYTCYIYSENLRKKK